MVKVEAVGRGEGYGRRGDGRLARPGCATRGSPTSLAATRGSGATQGEYRVSYYKVFKVILKADIGRDTASRSFNPFEDYFLCM